VKLGCPITAVALCPVEKACTEADAKAEMSNIASRDIVAELRERGMGEEGAPFLVLDLKHVKAHVKSFLSS